MGEKKKRRHDMDSVFTFYTLILSSIKQDFKEEFDR